jgi:hypothetical protein
MFLHYAEELGAQSSVVAEFIHPFNLRALLDGADGADTSDSSRFHDERDDIYFDLNSIAFYAMYCVESRSGVMYP